MSQPRKRAGLSEMARIAGAEASRIRAVQAALAKDGGAAATSATQIRRAEVFEDIERLIIAIMDVPDRVREVLAPVMRAMATAEKFERDREAAPPAETEHEYSEN